jgi:hypothetical protein
MLMWRPVTLDEFAALVRRRLGVEDDDGTDEDDIENDEKADEAAEIEEDGDDQDDDE